MTASLSTRRRGLRGCWLWGGIATVVLALIIALVISQVFRSPTKARVQTTRVTRGTIVSTVSGSGTIAAQQTLDLSFQVSGRVTDVKVRSGDKVQKGQILAQIDSRELAMQVASAEADLRSAQAKLEQSRQGNATPEQLAASQADVTSAAAQLEKTRTGNVTEADIVEAEANVRSAQAQLEQTRTSTASDIAQAEAALRSAQAKLDDLLSGPHPEDLSAAQATVAQAEASYQQQVANLQETRDTLSKSKTDAEVALKQAAIALQQSQTDYSVAYWNYQAVINKGRAPTTTQPDRSPELTDYGNLQEHADFKQAELTLHDAEATLRQAEVDLDNARQAEVTGIRKAEQEVASAEAHLRDAREQLRIVQQGATAPEIVQAQAEVDQARAKLEQLQNGGAAAQVTASQASLDQAQAQLVQLQQGGTLPDIVAAQADLERAEANLNQLSMPATATDLAIQQAAVDKAEQSLKQAKLNLEYANLTAPFDGIITNVAIVPGSIVGESTAAISMIDRSTLHVDLTLSENDVVQVSVGQVVTVTVDSLPNWQASGVVSYVAPAAETSNDVVTYDVQVDFKDTEPRVKIGMTANADIIADRKDNVLLVPNAALLPLGTGRAVQVPGANGGNSRQVPVETGLTDGSNTEVVSGLREGQEIIAVASAGQGQERSGGFPFRPGR